MSFFRNVPFVPGGLLESTKEPSNITTSNDTNEASDFYRSILALPSDASKDRAECQRRQQERRRRRLNAIISGKIPAQPAVSPVSTSGITKARRRRPNTTSETLAPEKSVDPSVPAPAVQEDCGPAADNESIWCSTCEMTIHRDDAFRHRHGTAHLVSQDSAIRSLDSLMLGSSNKGFKMMLSSGWDCEKGLGAEGQGRRHPIATQLRPDRRALGSANVPKKLVTHKIEEIESARRGMALLTADDHRRKAKQESQERVAMMKYMKSI
ncbi:G patch domain and ankyrin repeat-containing protein 1 [Actinomortierella ambigua]|uniref:G patch domain and ankyrin repeat-containing protein 1 n=1 Tax=Actinomortierella ambigua TaxID=1343610 RepID=A0A9P6U032_9FUNG|nr:G patch domain and ankyrin repeat-containing protein 1 [Actinomortierella ambigua]